MATEQEDTRRGWAWTLGRCGLATALLAALGAGVLYFLLTRLTPPWWVPQPVLEWLLTTVRPYALLLGALLGGALGVPVSVVIVVRDARRGRLSRLV
jgi:hypothetical protein